MLESESKSCLSFLRSSPGRGPTGGRSPGSAASRRTDLGARARPGSSYLRAAPETPTGCRDGRRSPEAAHPGPPQPDRPDGRPRTPCSPNSGRKKMREGSGRWQPTGEELECQGAPPLPTCVKLQLVTGQRLEGELVTLETGIQQRSLHAQRAISSHLHSHLQVAARELIKLLLKGPRFARSAEARRRRGSHPRKHCAVRDAFWEM